MKKIFFFFSVFLSTLTAAPVGNPSAPKLIEEGFFIPPEVWLELRFGYEGDFVTDARLRQVQGGHVDCYRQETNAGTMTLNLLERLDLYTVLGSSRTRAEWRFDHAGDTQRVELETLYDFLWGLGVRGILYERGKASLGVGARYEHANYDPVWLTVNGTVEPAHGTHLRWRAWQVDLALSYKIEIFSPYIGLKYSNVQAKVGKFQTTVASNGSGSNVFDNRYPIGVFIGCSLTTSKYFMLNVEGRLVDEEAVTISGDVRF
jgi:hypothetical protein